MHSDADASPSLTENKKLVYENIDQFSSSRRVSVFLTLKRCINIVCVLQVRLKLYTLFEEM